MPTASTPRHPRACAHRPVRAGPIARPRTYEQPALAALPLNPRRGTYVLNLILQQHNWRHSSKHKGVSHKTIAERARFCHWLFGFLRQHPKRFKLDPRSFSGRHVEAVTRHWQAEARAGRMSPATIQTYFSFMRTFAGWIGKPRLLKPISSYFDDPALHRRSLAAAVDKTWRAQGVDADQVIRDMEAYGRNAVASLRLMQAFGLRFKESLMLRPHRDVLTAEQAGDPANTGTPPTARRAILTRTAAPRAAVTGCCPLTARNAKPPSRRPAAWPSAPTTA